MTSTTLFSRGVNECSGSRSWLTVEMEILNYVPENSNCKVLPKTILNFKEGLEDCSLWEGPCQSALLKTTP